MLKPAAIGLRAHSGWAAAVALSGTREVPVVVLRRRISMREPGAVGPLQPYHAAAGLDLAEAAEFIARAASQAAALAASGLQAMLADLSLLGHNVTRCAILLGSGRPLPALEKILAAHPLLHTAEGEMFREALRSAGEACCLSVKGVPERGIFASAGFPDSEPLVAQLGKAIGPPWQMDQKLASAAAWMALHRG